MQFANWGTSNSGSIVVEAGRLDFMDLSNNGRIDISSNGSLHVSGGLSNYNTVNLHEGQIYGNVYNADWARINIGGGSRPAIFDGFQNYGTVLVGTSAIVSFYGDVSGAGQLHRSGTAEFLGTYKPPAAAPLVWICRTCPWARQTH